MLEKILPKNIGFFELFEQHVASTMEAAKQMELLLDAVGTRAGATTSATRSGSG